jgi:hypothetical protein
MAPRAPRPHAEKYSGERDTGRGVPREWPVYQVAGARPPVDLAVAQDHDGPLARGQVPQQFHQPLAQQLVAGGLEGRGLSWPFGPSVRALPAIYATRR